MYTSMAVLALANFIAPSPSNPVWSGDYWTAQRLAQKEQKPLAVFIGSGQKGFNWEGDLTERVQKILADKYVCVYLDTKKQTGKSLAEEFEITKGLGLVISDRSGRIQAYHHDGGLAASELAAKLQRFASANLEVQTTESNSRTSFYPSGQTYTQPYIQHGGGRGC